MSAMPSPATASAVFLRLCAAGLVLLAGCGGGADTAHAAPQKVFVQPSDRLVSAAGYDTQIQPTPAGAPLPDVAADVLRQSRLGQDVILWIGGKTAEVAQRFPALINEAKKYPNIRSVYLMDEMLWNGSAVEMGLHEAEVLQGARTARAAGLKTVISMLPEVVLHPDFKLQDINAYSVIGLDVYPSIRVDNNTYGCRYSDNLLENLLRCSIDKLRAVGFTGQIGYLYQAFALNTLPVATSEAHMALQRPVIDWAPAYGVSVIVPWGIFLGATELAAEPYLHPLGGTPYEHLVRP